VKTRIECVVYHTPEGVLDAEAIPGAPIDGTPLHEGPLEVVDIGGRCYSRPHSEVPAVAEYYRQHPHLDRYLVLHDEKVLVVTAAGGEYEPAPELSGLVRHVMRQQS